MDAFASFEVEINKNFPIQKNDAISDRSRRSGILGYKIGMTHFWDKWGQLIPCSVV
jgi:hypothetical protein